MPDLSRDTLEQFQAAALLGLGRSPLPPALAALTQGLEPDAQWRAAAALAGLRMALADPAPPPAELILEEIPHIDVAGGLCPEPARLRCRLLLDDPGFGLAVLMALRRRGLLLHPFDIPLLPKSKAIRDFAILLDPRSRAQLDLPPDPLQAHGWSKGDAGERNGAFALLRLTRPVELRATLPAYLAEVRPERRLEAVELMAFGLGPEDLPILQGLLKDRSEPVRQAAKRLLTRLPGTAEAAEAAAALAAEFEYGGFPRRVRLTLDEDTVKADLPPLEHGCAGGFDAIAAGLGLTPDDLARRAPDMRMEVRRRLFPPALAAGRFDLAESLAPAMTQAGLRRWLMQALDLFVPLGLGRSFGLLGDMQKSWSVAALLAWGQPPILSQDSLTPEQAERLSGLPPQIAEHLRPLLLPAWPETRLDRYPGPLPEKLATLMIEYQAFLAALPPLPPAAPASSSSTTDA